MRILLIGGGKSGKSTMAQRLAAALSGDAPRYYWATMTPHDDEDLARIRRHVADRAGMDFITVERSFDLPAALPALDRHGTVLFDSVTACLSEQMFPGPAPDAGAGYCGSCWISAVTSTILSLCATISGTAARTTGTGRKFMFGAWRISVKGWQRNLTWYVR